MSYDDYQSMAMNSQTRHLIVPAMSDSCLRQAIAACILNCQIRKTDEPVTYEEGLFNSYLPELLKRFDEKITP